MDIDIVKMEGAGNDYIYMDLLRNRYDVNYADLARKISSRHFGVGGDGLVLIMKGTGADFKMRMFNSDGSEAEMCGNAIRCVGKYLYDHGYLDGEEFPIETLAGEKRLWIVEKNESGKATRLKVDMGSPILNGKDIPVDIAQNPVIGIDIMGYRGNVVSMGNPHLVIFVERITDKQVLEDGPKLEKNSLFPRKTNVEFVRVIDDRTIDMRVWERGTGETLACGTGACASVVAGVLSGSTSRKVNVNVRGGMLSVEWDEESSRVYLTGPATEVFYGVYYYDEKKEPLLD